MSMVNFYLAPHIYAAQFEDSIIILDANQNSYFSIVETSASFLLRVLDETFVCIHDDKFAPVNNNLNYDLDELNHWISYFLEQQFIVKSAPAIQKHIASYPLQDGGLTDYKWDQKPSWKPFLHSSKYQVLKALFELIKVHHLVKNKGIQEILNLIKKISSKKTKLCNPSKKEINELASIIDAATILYSQKTFCLAWATTFVVMAFKKNWSCNLVIGIQTNPFYAHAWAESAGRVIHDDPIIAKVLSIILREPLT